MRNANQFRGMKRKLYIIRVCSVFLRNLLQEHAKLVVEENTILMQEIDLKDRRIDEMQEDFDLESKYYMANLFQLTYNPYLQCNGAKSLKH